VKKILAVCQLCLLAGFLAIGLMRCSSSNIGPERHSDEAKVKVLSSTAMIDDVVGQIGGEHVDHDALIIGEIDPHSYELVKGDDEKIEAAHIVFYNGLNLEHGASLRYKIEKHPHAIAVGDYILRTYPEMVLKVDNEIDPHIWMDIGVWLHIIDPILEALVQVDPEHKAYYEKNAALLLEKMKSVHEKIFNEMQQIPSEKRYLVTSHDAFCYFTRSYLATPEERLTDTWQKRFAAPEGLAPDGQLSAYDLQKIIDHLCAHKISIVFPESNVSRDSLKKIVMACKEKNADIRFSTDVLYGDSMGGRDSRADSYLKMIEHNAAILMKEWQ
jgi:manganese/zinc/iron transport system substrate-binding protein